MTIESLLSRLHKVKPRGNNQWWACCPAHNDKTPSLSIKDDNGKVIMHCFGQECSIDSICGAIGLDISELFPPSDNVDYSRTKDRVYFDPKRVLEALQFEASVVYFAAKQLQRGPLCDEDMARLRQAVTSISASMEYVKR